MAGWGFSKQITTPDPGQDFGFHRSIKERVCLLLYCLPEELKRAVDDVIIDYADTSHTALENIIPGRLSWKRRKRF